MFSGETAVELTTRLDEVAFRHKVQEALAGLGRARVDDRGGLTVWPYRSFGSVLTEVNLDGDVRPLGDGGYDVAVRYACKPTGLCWALAVVLFLTTAVGAAILLYPLYEKKQVAARVRQALTRLEDVADDRPG